MTGVHYCTILGATACISQNQQRIPQLKQFLTRARSTEKNWGGLLRGTDKSEKSEGVGLFNINVPTKA